MQKCQIWTTVEISSVAPFPKAVGPPNFIKILPQMTHKATSQLVSWAVNLSYKDAVITHTSHPAVYTAVCAWAYSTYSPKKATGTISFEKKQNNGRWRWAATMSAALLLASFYILNERTCREKHPWFSADICLWFCSTFFFKLKLTGKENKRLTMWDQHV